MICKLIEQTDSVCVLLLSPPSPLSLLVSVCASVCVCVCEPEGLKPSVGGLRIISRKCVCVCVCVYWGMGGN